MRIGVIGAGNIGGTLTQRLTALGHEVTVANSRGPATLTELAERTGATPAGVTDAVRHAELVVLAVPLRAVPDLPATDFGGRVVVDANNYYPERDGDLPEVADRSITSSRWVADHLPGARVVKAFNTIAAEQLRDGGVPAGSPQRIAVPVAGDDPEATRVVRDVVEQLGFDAVEAGTLDESWRQQPQTPVYGTDLDAAGVLAGLGAARP
ncbi:NADPH-dependent F420 reductase [Melissospora conviva]